VLALLIQRRRWTAGLALSGVGALLQVLALHVAPLTVVQPTLALGVVALVIIGGRVLAEPTRGTDVVAAGALALGVTLIAIAGADLGSRPVDAGAAAAALGTLAAILAVAVLARQAPPLLLVVGAGAGDSLAALAAERLAHGWDLLALVWIAPAAAAVVGSLSTEMAAVSRWPATRVGPCVLALQTAVPVLLAPVVAGERWGAHAGPIAAGLLLVVGAGGVLAASAARFERREPGADHVCRIGQGKP
jgi:hypothetical protein